MRTRVSLLLALCAFVGFGLVGCSPVPAPAPVPEITIPKPPPPLPPAPAPAPSPDPAPYEPSGSPSGSPFGSPVSPTGLVLLAKTSTKDSDRLSAFDERLERVEVNQAAADHRLDDLEARVDKLEMPPEPVKSAEVQPKNSEQNSVPDPEASTKPFIAPTSPVANGVTYRSGPVQCVNGQCYQVQQYSAPAVPVQRYGSAATGRWFRIR